MTLPSAGQSVPRSLPWTRATTLTTALASLAFFTSGFAALVYQIVWQRLLVLPIGADVYSTTIIVGAFMAGLGGGSLIGGYLADRLEPRRALVMFVAAELAVGTFGLTSPLVFYDWMYIRLGAIATQPIATASIVFLSLLWPTFWMGTSLPLLARAITRRISAAPTLVGLLYGLNTLGAAAGAFATTWLILPDLGLVGGVRFAAFLNLVAALAASLLGLRVFANRDPVIEAEAAPTVSTTASDPQRISWPFAVWAGLYAVAGFQSLSLEIVWFRLLGVMVKSSAFTFGTLLTIYLAGLGAGAAGGGLLLPRVSRPGRTFLLLQAFVGLYAGASVFVLVSLVGSSSILAQFRDYFASYEPLDAASTFATFWTSHGDSVARAQLVRLYVVLPVVLVGPPTIAMGASFSLLQKIALVDLGRLGSRVGQVLVANIAGSTAGSIVTGWIALTYLGSAGTVKLVVVVSALFLVLAILKTGDVPSKARVPLAALLFVLVGIAVVRLPDGSRLWARLHGASPNLVAFAEDASGMSLLKTEPRRSGETVVFVNGIGQSWIPYGNIHSVLGALPAFVHPKPREAAIIGLGSGDTLYSLAGRLELSRVTCIEIIRPQLAMLSAWAGRTGYPALSAMLSDRRIEHVQGDGRIFVMRSNRLFDIIEADALRPTSAYSGNLYSTGYFQLLRAHLAPQGIAVTWSPTPRIHDTFTATFPHVLSFGDIVLGSNDPIRFNPAEIKSRLEVPAVQAYYRRAGMDIRGLLAPYLDRTPRQIGWPEGQLHPVGDLNEDLFPRDEFSVPTRNENP